MSDRYSREYRVRPCKDVRDERVENSTVSVNTTFAIQYDTISIRHKGRRDTHRQHTHTLARPAIRHTLSCDSPPGQPEL